jgi:hypothetical protein
MYFFFNIYKAGPISDAAALEKEKMLKEHQAQSERVKMQLARSQQRSGDALKKRLQSAAAKRLASKELSDSDDSSDDEDDNNKKSQNGVYKVPILEKVVEDCAYNLSDDET